MDMNKKLYRSSTNRVICGVCGGLGEYFGVDPISRSSVCKIRTRFRQLILYSASDTAFSCREVRPIKHRSQNH